MDSYIDQDLVNRTAPAERDVFVRDSKLGNFRLKVTPRGKKVFRFDYRSPVDGTARAITLGTSPAMSADSARAAAMACAQALREGRDPAPEHREVKRTPTFAEAWAEFVVAHTPAPGATEPEAPKAESKGKRKKKGPTTWRASTAAEYVRIFDRYVDAKLKGRRVNEIAFRDLDAMVQRIARENGPVMAHNVKKRLATFFGWCGVGERYMSPNQNPTLGIKTDEPEAVHFVFESGELARLNAAMAEMAATEYPPNLLVIRFLLFVGCRKNEALQLRWSEIDWARKLVVLAPERHKTGGRSRERIIPLSSAALEVLEEAKAFGNAYSINGELPPFVFPSQRDRSRPIVGLQKIWDRVRTKAGITARIHDLRHNVGGVGGEHVNQVQVRDLLGHRKLTTTDRYMVTRLDAQFAAAETVSNVIKAELGSNVVRLGKKA